MLGYVSGGDHGAGDALIARAAEVLMARGLRIAGAVQLNREPEGGGRCEMDLRVLTGEEVVRISQDLGQCAEGCRLDPEGLERAVGLVEAALRREGAARPEILIVNKFGKQEAEGRGFRPAIGQAVAEGIPVLTAVAEGQREAFLGFAGEFAQPVAARLEAIVDWALAAAGRG
ncbi:MAG: DUF2478 domain-containing protein [Alphaproteobacteria bacterium]|nr:MAG: DUF2478 domain-containing protein [Alphaproteobacteria bacterium]